MTRGDPRSDEVKDGSNNNNVLVVASYGKQTSPPIVRNSLYPIGGGTEGTGTGTGTGVGTGTGTGTGVGVGVVRQGPGKGCYTIDSR